MVEQAGHVVRRAAAGDDAIGLHEPERNLLLLMMSLVLVSFPVEVWQQPRVPDSGSAYLDLVVEPRV
jgi:hypothetical protein